MNIEPYCLHEVIITKIKLFMKEIGLRFGSIDLIVTPENEVVFLEINEQGQFLFLEEQCPEINIVGSMCQFLALESGLGFDAKWPGFTDYIESNDYKLLMEQRRIDIQKRNTSSIKYTF